MPKRKQGTRRHLRVHKRNRALSAQISKLERKLEDLEHCSICAEGRRNIVLMCGHSCCEGCVNKIMRDAKEAGKSPQCPFDRINFHSYHRLFL